MPSQSAQGSVPLKVAGSLSPAASMVSAGALIAFHDDAGAAPPDAAALTVPTLPAAIS